MTLMKNTVIASAAVSLLALAACNKAGKLPDGQVVATVDGNEVTIHELNAEMAMIGNRATGAPPKLVESGSMMVRETPSTAIEPLVMTSSANSSG